MKVEVELEELEELREQVDMLEHALANQTYNGNSIAYIYQKMKNYGDQAAKLHKLNQEMLKMLEWNDIGMNAKYCLVCNRNEHWGHGEDCELAALIAKAEGEQG